MLSAVAAHHQVGAGLVLRAKYESSTLGTERPKVIVITGPTGVGKSSLGIALAKRLGGEIISADSVQVYKGLDVGSSKTPVREREGVTHHLLDVLEPTEEYSVFKFLKDAREATKTVLSRGHVPIVVGGAAFYLLWYIHAKPDALKITEDQFASFNTKMSNFDMDWDLAIQYLTQAGDPETAQKLARDDWHSLRRALKILKVTGKPQGSVVVPWERSLYSSSDLQDQWDYDFRCYFLYAMQSILFQEIDLRCEQMLANPQGLLQEASWLLRLGIAPDSNPASRAIGYRHAMEYILACRSAGGVTTPIEFSKFLSSFQMATRNYAKRQVTWFRDDPNFRWLDTALPREALLQSIEKDYGEPWGTCKLPSSWEVSEKTSQLAQQLHPKPPDPRQYFPKNKIYTRALAWTNALQWMREA